MKTRQWVVSLILLAGCIFQSSAQQEFHFTPKAGINLANIYGTGGTDLKPGLNIGFSAEWMLLPKFSIEPGVFYSMQGCKFESDTEIKLDYINIPILAKYYIVKGFNVFAGPQFGFNTKAELDNAITNEDTDVKDYIKTFDFGMAAGLGYQFDMGLMVSTGFNWSFLNQAKESKFFDLENDKYHNTTFQFNVGWRF
ncbi:MAG: PorT family protein [Tannerella sp.]|jgi:hypothetical protein|nr:PorT family protein [Tannerella sp.]